MTDAQWLQFGQWLGATLVLLGVQWGIHRTELKHVTKELADVAVKYNGIKQMLEDSGKSLKVQLVESQEAQSEYLEARFTALEHRLTAMDTDRKAEFLRLHSKADQAQRDIAANWTQAHRDFVTREEYNMVAMNLRTLESRVNAFMEMDRKTP